jgi:beta-N-acetylhexosaminidase
MFNHHRLGWIFFRMLFFAGLLSSTLGATVFPVGASRPDSKVENLSQAKVDINSMTTEEKIGQLFLITFNGSDFGENSQIFNLIANRHIGGVLLENRNDNFSGPENVLQTTYNLTSGLQNIAGQANKNAGKVTYLPLFIAISQNGDRATLDQLISGMTPLPNQLALGATWNPELAEKTGHVLGAELSALGFNMFLGPSLDVLDNVPSGGSEDLGAQVFGGDPYWVGLMGQAYIRGLHEGSNARVAVISKNFPGRGGSDRPSEEEVATVRKSLEQLKQIELAPFFSVTGNTNSPEEITDGLLVSHIRYQGFQGNIRATTKPVSFDPSALESILGLEPIAGWRQNGGVVISDNLGSQSIRKFFDPTNSGFDARQIARNAFLAGNDILLLDQNFISSGDADANQTINRTLDFFIQKYDEDPAFAQRVDQSVARIVALKEKLYPFQTLAGVIPPVSGLANFGISQQASFDTARESVTLISPDLGEVKNILPVPPENVDRIVFFTDTMTARQCSQCPDEVQLGVDTLQNAVLRLYGPHGSSQVMQSHLASYSFNRLNSFLNDPGGDPELDTNLKSADWVIFSILDIQKEDPESGAIFSVLNDHPELIRNKKTIVFAFNAPYYLDATDISKLTAYYAFYSKVSPFIDIAARILFQEVSPVGASPVSIPGVGYEIIVATSPDPNQVISLGVEPTGGLEGTPQTTETTEPQVFNIGDTLPITTGVIVDHNGHPVPDGTIARFVISTGTETITTQQIETATTGGIAKASYPITQPGRVEIRVVSEPAMVSQVLQLEVKEGEGSQVTAIAPTPVFTSTPAVSPTPDENGNGTNNGHKNSTQPLRFSDWLISIFLIGLASLGIYQIGKIRFSSRWGVRWATCAAIGGLLFYTLALLGWKQTILGVGNIRTVSLAAISMAGVAIGWGIGFIWVMLPRWTNKRD